MTEEEIVPFLDLRKQYLSIKSEIDQAIASVIEESAYVGGSTNRFVNEFEQAFARYLDVRECVAVGNGTDALEIAISALQLPSRSEIIVPAFSFVASAEAVVNAGHEVVFCDVDSKTFTMSPNALESVITDRTRAIMPVHLYGHPADMGPILELATRHNLRVIEDCAQAHGARYKDVSVGGLGDLAAFSFYPGKNLGAYGDAGAIVTNDTDLAQRCRMIANHGRIAKYDHAFVGRNSRMDGIQAAILSVKLIRLNPWNEHRRLLADRYRTKLSALTDICLPVEAAFARHVYHLFVVLTPDRDRVKTNLESLGIATGIHYPVQLPDLPAFRHYVTSAFPCSKDLARRVLSLPIGDHMSADSVDRVAECFRQV